ASLLAAGVPGSAPVNIVASAETPDTQRVTTQLGSLADTVRARQVANPAIIFVTWPLALAAAAGEPARAKLAA
ncbi:MAG: uroporphyrinogen-III C-methyltransferase, partial [Pseudomonadota bacterium]